MAMRHYYRKDWQKFRDEVIELDGGVCRRCGRGPLQGAILQVHHKTYLPGKMPWEYPYGYCETLCRGCHASEHGIVRPFQGWVCVGDDDLGDLSGECDLCGTQIRYVFFVQHEKWPAMEVGEICCDHLTQTSEASDYMDSKRRYALRESRFISSSRWKRNQDGLLSLMQKGQHISLEKVSENFRLTVNQVTGKKFFKSEEECKRYIFKIIENGTLEAFFRKFQAK